MKAEGKLVPGGFTRTGVEGERLVRRGSLEYRDDVTDVGSDTEGERKAGAGRSPTAPFPYEKASNGHGWAPLGG